MLEVAQQIRSLENTYSGTPEQRRAFNRGIELSVRQVHDYIIELHRETTDKENN